MVPQLTAQLKHVQVLQTIFKNNCLALFSIYFQRDNVFKGFHLPVNAISNNTAVMIRSGRTVINRIPVDMTLNFTFKRDKMA